MKNCSSQHPPWIQRFQLLIIGVAQLVLSSPSSAKIDIGANDGTLYLFRNISQLLLVQPKLPYECHFLSIRYDFELGGLNTLSSLIKLISTLVTDNLLSLIFFIVHRQKSGKKIIKNGRGQKHTDGLHKLQFLASVPHMKTFENYTKLV